LAPAALPALLDTVVGPHSCSRFHPTQGGVQLWQIVGGTFISGLDGGLNAIQVVLDVPL
jgi:hypothetical protein